MSETKQWLFGGSGVTLLVAGIVSLAMWGCPQYDVYRQTKKGEAALRESESSRQIAVQEAKAKKESAALLAEAEIERARGVAQANKIIGDSLKENHEYLIWLWIDKLDHSQTSVIYVPTEGGLPILEAGRFTKPVRQEK